MSRLERIRQRLAALESRGIVRSYYSYSPGGDGRRWSLDVVGGYGRVYSTSELECFLLGAESALSARVTV